ncbi:MAG: hypothetical protein FWF08_09735 [Oscillospiraceae bacterium]|nr:hypothetical protein [Oscillospiraceae bacterium]
MKRLIKILKKKHLYFIIIVYPLLVYLAGSTERLLYDVFNTGLYYGFIAALVSVIIVLFTIVEIIKRIQGYELQGDKLKMRKREGIHIEDSERNRQHT